MNDNIIEQRFSELFAKLRELDKNVALNEAELRHIKENILDLYNIFKEHDEAEMRKFEKVDESIQRFEKILWICLGAMMAMQSPIKDVLIKIIG